MTTQYNPRKSSPVEHSPEKNSAKRFLSQYFVIYILPLLDHKLMFHIFTIKTQLALIFHATFYRNFVLTQITVKWQNLSRKNTSTTFFLIIRLLKESPFNIDIEDPASFLPEPCHAKTGLEVRSFMGGAESAYWQGYKFVMEQT